MMPHRVLVRRYGLQGEIMVLLGAVWILVGLGQLFDASANPEIPSMFHVYIPLWIRIGLWLIPGVASIWAGITRHTCSTILGVMFIAPAIFAASYLWSWIIYLIPAEEYFGFPYGWYIAAFYGVMMGFVFFAAHVGGTKLPYRRHQ